MEYTTRIVRSSEGLSKEAALLGLQEHPSFMPGTKIANIYNQGGRWVAKLMEPKTAEVEVEPCEHCEDKGCQHCKKTAAGAFEDIDESPAEMHDESHEEHEALESPFEELEEHDDEDHEEKHEQSEEKKLNELEKKLDLLLEALGINEKGEEPEIPGAPKGKGPADLPAAPEPDKGPKHEPLPPGSGAKLKPGEVPNKPGMTPVGAPSFASVKTASCEGECEEGSCENCDSKREANAPKSAVASFTASKLDAGNTLTIRQAKAQLENHYEGFRVARIKRDGNAIHARMEYVAGPNPVTRGEAQDSNAVYQKEFDQRLQENAINRQKAIRKVDPYYNMDPLNQSYENEKDQEFTEEHHELPYPGADEYSQNYF